MSTKHIIILKTGFHIAFDHIKNIDWEHVRAIIHDNTVEISQARWDGKNYEMLCDENALSKNNAQLNQKATMAYRDYWNSYSQKHPEDARDTNDINRRNIYGNVVLVDTKLLSQW